MAISANERARQYREKYPERVRRSNRNCVKWRQERVDQIKVNSPCQDCHHSFPPECMDFDHRDWSTKVAGIGRMVMTKKPWEDIVSEISKCDLVCANCHRIRTKQKWAILREEQDKLYAKI